MMSWEGVDGTQKHRVPRERQGSLSHIWVRTQTAGRNRTAPQIHQAPFPPQGLCTCYSLCVERAFSVNYCSPSTLSQAEALPKPLLASTPRSGRFFSVIYTQTASLGLQL